MLKVIIICDKHGDFNKLANSHLRGQGCPKCGNELTGFKLTTTNEGFINKAKIIHKYTYKYDNVHYVNDSTKVYITCSVHGDFYQKAGSHLQGKGCPKCGKESHWKRSDYIKKANERVCTFYTIRCFNENEEFYKIGITMNKLSVRYQKGILPYNYEVVSETLGEAGFIWDLELSEKRKLKEFNYQPIIPFRGSVTECFTKYKYGSN